MDDHDLASLLLLDRAGIIRLEGNGVADSAGLHALMESAHAILKS